MPLFEGLTEDELDLIQQKSRKIHHGKGETILSEGEQSEKLYLILRGEVKVFLEDSDGREFILSTLKQGNFFGEISLIDKLPCSATVAALKDSTLVVVDGKEFNSILGVNPQLSLNLLREMCSRLRIANDRIGSLALMNISGRLAQCLIDIARREGSRIPQGTAIRPRPSHKRLAGLVASSRETISRLLNLFHRQGLIALGKNELIIRDELEDMIRK